jgi:hypothetical protein
VELEGMTAEEVTKFLQGIRVLVEVGEAMGCASGANAEELRPMLEYLEAIPDDDPEITKELRDEAEALAALLRGILGEEEPTEEALQALLDAVAEAGEEEEEDSDPEALADQYASDIRDQLLVLLKGDKFSISKVEILITAK